MWRLLSVVRRGLGWPRKGSARVADEGALESAGEAGAEARRPGWGGGLAALVAVARVPSLAVASCLACHAEEEEEPGWTSGRRPRADEINHLMMHDSMRYRIYA
ncbi:uncharacterized protein [Elaeis guineensis]|uniref:uncharacterized protein n=1 Tax=Elaeis guineensis var. tenera TaxID=51953 RepID=UPI00057AE651